MNLPLRRGDVVYVAPYFPPDLGGMEKVAERLARGVAGRRKVVVLTSTSAAEPTGDYPATMTVRRLKTFRVAQIPFMPTLGRELLRTSRSSVIHVHVAQAYVPEVVYLVAKLTRRPYVAHFHLDVGPSTRLGPLFLLYKRYILSRVLRAATRIVALSDEQADLLQTTYGVARHRICVIPNGVADEFLDEPGEAPVRHTGPFRLLFVGRLSPQKNLPRLLEAVARVRADVELTIVGSGSCRPAVEAQISRLGLSNVRLAGEMQGADLVKQYRRADALVLTSDREGMPLVLLEAMASGLPIVATDVDGIGATVGDAGLVVAPDPRAVARAIDRLAGDQALRDDLSRRAFVRGAMFRWDKAVEALDDLYSAVAG